MSSFRKVVEPVVGNVSQEEMELLLAVMGKVLKSEVVGMPTRGSIAMYEQRRGENEECVFILNMKDGEMENFPCDEGKTAPSEYMADQAIRELARWPEEGAYESKLNTGSAVEFGQLKTDIYHGNDDYVAMSLNATLGRFLVSSYVEFQAETTKELRDKNDLLLATIAEIMRRLRPEDRALYYSVKEMLEFYLCVHSEHETYFEVKMSIVRQAFLDGSLPELKAWKKWREEQKAKGGLMVFFDYDPDEECDEFFEEYFGDHEDGEDYEDDRNDYDDCYDECAEDYFGEDYDEEDDFGDGYDEEDDSGDGYDEDDYENEEDDDYDYDDGSGEYDYEEEEE